MPDGFVPIVKVIEIANDGYGFSSGSWYDAISRKIQHFIDTLESQPEGGICVCCDVDILFTRKSKDLADYLRAEIANKDLDMLFMREDTGECVNGGFYCVRNSEPVRNALKQAMLFCEKRTSFADQDYFNGIFKQSGVKWDYIDIAIVAWGWRVYDSRRTLFHHAVCSRNLDDKLRQQQEICRQFQIELPE